MFSALFYLQSRSVWNRLVTRFKRLKNPKYLIGFLVGGLYFYWYFIRYLGGAGRRAGTASALGDFTVSAQAIELIAALVLMVVVVGGWLLPNERAALAFTEAEAVYLFSAPIPRRTLIHFKLLKSQAGIFFTTLLMGFLSTRFGASGGFWIYCLGWWVILSMLNLHMLGASFLRTKLLEHGYTNRHRRLFVLLVVALAGGAVIFWARDSMRAPLPEEMSLKKFPAYVEEMLGAGPAPYLLWPFRIVVRPCLARETMSFLAALGPALVLLVLHYVWVIRSNVAFEEASLALAQKRAQMVSAAKQGQLGIVKHKARRAPFELPPTGAPAFAFLWKNLIAAGNLFRGRVVIVMGLTLAFVALFMALTQSRGGFGVVIGMLVMMALIWSVMLGPMILRHDFRSDLKSMDVLKLYPLAGWRVVLGELLAPAFVLTVVQWLLLLVGVIAVQLPEAKGFGFVERLAVAAGAALVLPMLNVVSFLIPNAAVLLFPAWFQSGQDATAGIEATGQRLIFGLGQFFVFLVALVPAGLVAFVVFLFARFAVPWTLALPLSAAPAAVILAIEAAIGIGLLGKAFERFDLSSEPAA